MNDGKAFPATFLNLVVSEEQSWLETDIGQTSLFTSHRPIVISFRLLNCIGLGDISKSYLNLKSKELTDILSVTPGFVQRAYAALRCYALQLRTDSYIIDGSEYFASRYPAKSWLMNNETTLAWVCGASSSPVAYIQYVMLEDSGGDTHVLITGLAVEESYRRHGYGRGLVLSAIAGTPGCKEIWVSAKEENYAAVSLYHQCGFETKKRRWDYSLATVHSKAG